MNESGFNSEIISTFKSDGFWAHKIPDLPRKTVKKPFDIFASVGGTCVAIESKFLKKFEAFSKRNFSPHQLSELSAISKKGEARSFCFLNIRSNSWDKAGKLNRLIIFDWWRWEAFFLSGQVLKATHLKELEWVSGKKGLFQLSEFYSDIRIGTPYGSGPQG